MRTFNVFKEILKNFREQDYFCQRLVAQTFPEEKPVKILHNNGNQSVPQHGTGVVVDGEILETSAETDQDLVSCTDILHSRSPGS